MFDREKDNACKDCGEICGPNQFESAIWGGTSFGWLHGHDCKTHGPKAPDVASYEGGAKRSKKLPRYELIDPTFLHEIAEVMAAGAIKYGELNWQRGGQDYVQDIPRHMLLHVFGIMSGDTSENHLANLICNGMMMAKLRKQYPYQVAGAPEQLVLEVTQEGAVGKLSTYAKLAESLMATIEAAEKLVATPQNAEDVLDCVEKKTREECIVSKILGQCAVCHLDVLHDQNRMYYFSTNELIHQDCYRGGA